MQYRSLVALVAVSLTALLNACVATRTAGSQCVVQTECNDPLLCSAGFCRAQCGSDSDCASGEQCAYARDVRRNVCFNATGTRTCGANPCGTGTTCIDALCVSLCSAGCPSGTACSRDGRNCVAATTPADAGADAGPEAGTDGAPSDVPSPTDAQPEGGMDVGVATDSGALDSGASADSGASSDARSGD
ncbi:MAG: hypothetical protein JNK05_17415 [Myxococcales bacterium]|nr:hypothetical protein [Myxococcales bacterium]